MLENFDKKHNFLLLRRCKEYALKLFLRLLLLLQVVATKIYDLSFKFVLTAEQRK